MQRLEVSGAVRPIYGSLGVKRLRNYRYALRNNPEERRSRQLRGGSLKSRKALPARGIFSYP